METGVDTSALYYYVLEDSFVNSADRTAAAKAISKIVAAYSHGRLYIPAAVVLELSNVLHHKHGFDASLKVIEALLEDSKNEITESHPADFTDALIVSKRLRVKYSDCLVYLSLKRAGVRSIITDDEEFAKFSDMAIA